MTSDAQGNLDIIDCGNVNITDTAKNAVAVYGDMNAVNVASLVMIGEAKGISVLYRLQLCPGNRAYRR